MNHSQLSNQISSGWSFSNTLAGRTLNRHSQRSIRYGNRSDSFQVKFSSLYDLSARCALIGFSRVCRWFEENFLPAVSLWFRFSPCGQSRPRVLAHLCFVIEKSNIYLKSFSDNFLVINNWICEPRSLKHSCKSFGDRIAYQKNHYQWSVRALEIFSSHTASRLSISVSHNRLTKAHRGENQRKLKCSAFWSRLESSDGSIKISSVLGSANKRISRISVNGQVCTLYSYWKSSTASFAWKIYSSKFGSNLMSSESTFSMTL